MFKDLLFGGLGARTIVGDVGLLIFRVCISAMMAIGHGWGKLVQTKDGVTHYGPPAMLVDGVAKLNFPAPTLFAWAVVFAEVGASILIAVGFLTRPMAAIAAFNMTVAAFLVHQHDPFFSAGGRAKEMAVLYLLPAVLLLFTGAGRFSVDAIMRVVKKDGGI